MTKEEMAIKFYENQQMIKALEEQNEQLKTMMLEAMADEETDTIMAGNIKAMTKTVNATRFDSKSFKADHADLYNEYTKKSFQTRFTVNWLK